MILMLLVACVGEPSSEALALGDAAVFAERAQPVLATCANPACHGNPDRPLEVYAEHLHRLDREDTWRDLPLTPEELWLNQVSASAFALALDAPEDSALLRKPLAPEAGGVMHLGGALFGEPSNPDYRALYDWVRTAWEEAP